MLVCVVEAWRQQGDVTEAAALAQIRALLAFRASDRAWARIRPLLDEATTPEAFSVGARVLVEQGRFPLAVGLLRKALERFPEDPQLTEQLERTELPNTLVDRTEPALGDVDGLVRVAEQLLATGNTLRGRGILERALEKQPDHPRASDLIWALDGDYELKGLRLHDLTRIYAGRLDPLPSFDEDAAEEKTERGLPEHLDLLEGPRPSGSFPSLFKNLEPRTELELFAETEQESTRAAIAEEVLPRWSLHGAEADTQIVRVVRKPPPTGPDGVDTDITSQVARTEVLDDVDGESEDEDVVVHRPREEDPFHERTETYRPLAVDPHRERLPPGARTADEGADFLAPRKRREPVIESLEPVPAPPEVVPPKAAPEPAREPTPPAPPVRPPAPRAVDDDDLDELTSLYRQPIGFAGWLVLGMLIGVGLLAVLALVVFVAFS